MLFITKILEGIEYMFMFSDKAKYDAWKKDAEEAIKNKLTTRCGLCGERIFPGQSVAEGIDKGKKIIVHTGFHYILESSDATVCETSALSIGYWDGKEIKRTGDSAANKALLSAQTENYDF